ncbi:MAG: DUF4249 family protein [Saprospiraceae bacterium]|nr:DUF4249 family protein [Saprospiraceae bacterium]
MKKLLFAAAIFMAAFQFSCSNDFEVNAPWKDIPVVYAMLDAKDSVHYIRLEKAFLTNDEDATEIAKIADSIYYENAKVQLERVSNGQLFTLTRVDGNNYGRPREEGVFATDPNWLYRIDSASLKMIPNEQYRIRIDRGNGLPEVTALALMIPPIKLVQPAPNTLGLNFSSTGVAKTTIAYEAPDSATIFDATLYIKYVEYPASNPSDLNYVTLEWPWARGLRRESNSNNFKIERVGKEFYEFMKVNIPEDETKERVFLGIDVELIGADNSVENYVNVSLANAGITASQELPTYSNISEGRGIFASISKVTKYSVGLSTPTRDTLRNGYLTKNLNF